MKNSCSETVYQVLSSCKIKLWQMHVKSWFTEILDFDSLKNVMEIQQTSSENAHWLWSKIRANKIKRKTYFSYEKPIPVFSLRWFWSQCIIYKSKQDISYERTTYRGYYSLWFIHPVFNILLYWIFIYVGLFLLSLSSCIGAKPILATSSLYP